MSNLISIVYITKRPGGYDILFNSLNQQTQKNYELICVDELVDFRREKIVEMAANLNINLKNVMKGKEKTFKDTKFGICNAFNTGLIEVKGDLVLFVQDNCWLPKNLLEKITNYYSDSRNMKHLLSFCERFFTAKCDGDLMLDKSTLSIFNTPIDKSPEELGLQVFKEINPNLKHVYEKVLQQNPLIKDVFVKYPYWECFCAVCPTEILRKLNGFDELLDYGDDCNEHNIWERAALLGYETIINANYYVQQIDHWNWMNDDTWKRFSQNTNMTMWRKMLIDTKLGFRPLRSDHNNFNLTPKGKFRLAFVWDWTSPVDQIKTWKDGLAAALQVISNKSDIELTVYTLSKDVEQGIKLKHDYFSVVVHNSVDNMLHAIINWDPKFVLCWGDITRPSFPELTKQFACGLCLAGGEIRSDVLKKFRVIFVENEVYYEEVKKHGFNVHIAFGTNTKLFKPNEKMMRSWALTFPASYSSWKRHHIFINTCNVLRKASNNDGRLRFLTSGIACEQNIKNVCIEHGINALDYISSDILVDIYNSSHIILVPSASNGGSQRTVLEAMACNTPIIVMSDSDKCSEFLRKAHKKDNICVPDHNKIAERVIQILAQGKRETTREWVLQNYSEEIYANKMYHEIKNVLGC